MLNRIFSDPHLFTKVLLFLYTCNVIRYCIFGMYGNAWYWFAAANITIAASWMMK